MKGSQPGFNGDVADAPYHAHVYYAADQRPRAEALQARLRDLEHPGGGLAVSFVGALRDGKVGPHPQSQFEAHFHARDLAVVEPVLAAAGLRTLIHPLTDDDLADHTALGRWLGEPIELDLSVLDPPGHNQGLARFGRTDV
jgi:DOPA 4,5-dioxygenase